MSAKWSILLVFLVNWSCCLLHKSYLRKIYHLHSCALDWKQRSASNVQTLPILGQCQVRNSASVSALYCRALSIQTSCNSMTFLFRHTQGCSNLLSEQQSEAKTHNRNNKGSVQIQQFARVVTPLSNMKLIGDTVLIADTPFQIKGKCTVSSPEDIWLWEESNVLMTGTHCGSCEIMACIGQAGTWGEFQRNVWTVVCQREETHWYLTNQPAEICFSHSTVEHLAQVHNLCN